MDETFGWTDIEDIALALVEQHPDRDPTAIGFPQLRQLVESLDGFVADPEHRVNEQILEAIQSTWIEEKEEADADDDDGPSYKPNNPFR
ncbi:Fe-S cluster assembly protein IscX [Mucisphaera sp.]|uniref:Fe-S cluster assembly protein IscX n=1 Tax=Mucisphaera sp. TaxID=2913024 RepID=UPI003D0C0713